MASTDALVVTRRRHRAIDHLKGWLDGDRLPYLAFDTAGEVVPEHYTTHLPRPDLIVAEPYKASLALIVIAKAVEGDILFVELDLLRRASAFEHLFQMPTFVVCFTSSGLGSSFWTRPALLGDIATVAAVDRSLAPLHPQQGLVVGSSAAPTATLALARAFRPRA